MLQEWHPSKNPGINPMSSKLKDKVWWRLPYDDPETGKHFDFEWRATIASRIQGNGCPFLSGKAVWPGFNDLTTKRPDLAAQWHPTKNNELTPGMVTYGSGKKVWWYLPYHDPETGKHFDFEWQATIANRIKDHECPYLLGRAVWPGYNDLETKRPDLAMQWHPTKNGKLTPEMVTCGSGKKVWWYLPYDDPITGKHFCFEWQASMCNRMRTKGCPFLTGQAVWLGYNDLATKCPDLAAQWHPTKNGSLLPEMVTCYSNKKVWWCFPYDDPVTGKHFCFEWQASICNRMRAKGCPFLTNQAIWLGYNDLATKRPDLAAQWHPTKNGSLLPEMVTCYSNKKVWWYLPYDDPETGKHFNFEWQACVNECAQGRGCPFLSGQAVWLGYNDLATKQPDLAAQWHPTKNTGLSPEMITSNSAKKVWWFLPYNDPVTGKIYNFEWQASIYSRVRNRGCPFLSGQAVWLGYNDLASKRPDLALQWHPTKNESLLPEMATCHSNKKIWWYLPYDDLETGKHFDFEWRASICNRASGSDCPFLTGMAVWPGFNDLETHSFTIAAEWHYIKNKKRESKQIYMHERSVKRWWRCSKCENEWRATVFARVVDGVTCPQCRRNKDHYR